MKETNQVFLQLREANRYAIAKNPLCRRLAVILLDNVVELQLRRKVDRELIWDQTTWYKGVRKYSDKLRRSVTRFHGDLLKFAKDQGWITQEDCHLLKFTHRIRNDFFHKGRFNEQDAELAIRLLYRFIGTYFPVWRVTTGLIEISPHEAIPIDTANDDETGGRPLLVGCEGKGHRGTTASGRVQSEEYWKKALRRILSYRPRENLRRLIKRRVTAFLNKLTRRLRYIDENKDLDFTWIVARRFSVLSPVFVKLYDENEQITVTGALNIYLAVLVAEERLLDIPDEVERAKEFHKLLDEHAFNANPISRREIARCRTQAQRILKSSAGDGICEFLRIEQQLSFVAEAVVELYTDMEGHIQMLIDERLGK